MNSPELIANDLWSERDKYPNLKNDEFASLAALLGQVKHEMRAMKSFSDIEGARRWFANMNDAANADGA